MLNLNNIVLQIFIISFIVTIVLLVIVSIKNNKNINGINQPINIKYPKLTFCLGISLSFLVGSFVYILANQIISGIAHFVLWISKISEKLDAVVIVSLISGTISITGVLISSIFGKYIEYKKKREEYLSQKREEAYGEFIEMVYKTTENINDDNKYSNKEMQNDISRFSKK